MTSNLSWVIPGVALIFAGSVAAQQPPEVRRVVTKIDASGKAVAMFDGQVQLTSFRSRTRRVKCGSPKTAARFSWSATRQDQSRPRAPRAARSSASSTSADDAEDREHGHQHMMKVVATTRRERPAAAAPDDAPHAQRRLRDHPVGRNRHAARRQRVHLKAGDVVVQQATNHAWVNRSGKPCRVAFILMDSQEP